MDILHRVVKAAKETGELTHHSHEAVARSSIATMFNWLGDPSDTAVEEAVRWSHGHVEAAQCRMIWARMLAEMRKEAGF